MVIARSKEHMKRPKMIKRAKNNSPAELLANMNDIKEALRRNPEEWAKYQAEVNQLHADIFASCLEMERKAKNEAELELMKRMFRSNFSEFIRSGSYNRHVMDRPYGYQGDFEIIDAIYKNRAETTGYERCMDEYFLNSPASVATRNRKEDFKRFLKEYSNECRSTTISILDLASGPCRDVIEFLEDLDHDTRKRIDIDCLDHDINAISYARELLGNQKGHSNIEWIQKNVLRVALAKDSSRYLPKKYDLIYSTGLFDYLNDKISIKLIRSLRDRLKNSGTMIISNYDDKSRNDSRVYMEWGVNWELEYRSEQEFKELFLSAGYKSESLAVQHEEQGIMQYCFATQ